MRNAESAALLESFLVAAVVSFLAIRAFLAATGYPRLGGNGIHIAHMLWGGLLMLAALMLLLAYLGRSVQHVAAIVAGLGFGTFVDEIGKFVTADNDYFFRPAVAIIYVTSWRCSSSGVRSSAAASSARTRPSRTRSPCSPARSTGPSRRTTGRASTGSFAGPTRSRS